MTTVKCPICKERVSAANTSDLNASLREHMADVHQMRELSMRSREGAPAGYYSSERYTEREQPREGTMERMKERVEPSSEERMRYEGSRGRDYPYTESRPEVGFARPGTRTEREVETWSNRNPEFFSEKAYVPREEMRQWRYPITGPHGERGPYYEREGARGREMTTERREVRGREAGMMATVNCPMCGQTLRGSDEDDLSDELRDHMSDVHDIRPKMSARLRY